MAPYSTNTLYRPVDACEADSEFAFASGICVGVLLVGFVQWLSKPHKPAPHKPATLANNIVVCTPCGRRCKSCEEASGPCLEYSFTYVTGSSTASSN
jgi:hypothetical protein